MVIFHSYDTLLEGTQMVGESGNSDLPTPPGPGAGHLLDGFQGLRNNLRLANEWRRTSSPAKLTQLWKGHMLNS